MFLFSSRRRHTIWPRDWSSDVCSSDLRSTSYVPRLRNRGDDLSPPGEAQTRNIRRRPGPVRLPGVRPQRELGAVSAVVERNEVAADMRPQPVTVLARLGGKDLPNLPVEFGNSEHVSVTDVEHLPSGDRR